MPPVSVKAALCCGGRWVLVRNDRGEWELPGGRIDPEDATLEDVVRRECREELGVDVDVGTLVGSQLFEVIPGHRVVIVSFAAVMDPDDEPRMQLSIEHDALGVFDVDELDAVGETLLPQVYRSAIDAARVVVG